LIQTVDDIGKSETFWHIPLIREQLNTPRIQKNGTITKKHLTLGLMQKLTPRLDGS